MSRFLSCVSRSNIILVMLINAALARSEVVINEIYYDHPGYDDGWEYIELYNNGGGEVTVGVCILNLIDGASGSCRELWSSENPISISPGNFLLISGEHYGPPDNLLLRGRVENGPDAVCLIMDGFVSDLVGYGDLDSPDMYESKPAIDTQAGYGLSRRPDGADSDTNFVDFTPRPPTPGKANFFNHDVEIRFAECFVLPCRGRKWKLLVQVYNCGLKHFTGSAGIDIGAKTEGELYQLGSESVYLDMEPSGSEIFELSAGDWHESTAEVKLSLLSEEDMNKDNNLVVRDIVFSPSIMVVNEIMYKPRKGGSEWIELYNTSQKPVDLNSWWISDSRMNRKVITDSSLILREGDFLILAQYPGRLSEFDCGSVVIGVKGGWPILNNGGSDSPADAVMIFNCEGVLVERVQYHDMSVGERGRSIERYDVNCCSDPGEEIWHRCGDMEGSTPGRANSVYSEGTERSDGFSISPNPFCPNVDSSLLISSSLRGGEKGFMVRIFDMAGFEVRNVFSEMGGAKYFSCRWDGRSWKGDIVPTGLYICVVEFVKSGGVVCRREKKCVAVNSGG
jgi:hypothetical protein